MSVIVFNGRCFSYKGSDGTQALFREVVADEFGKSMLAAAI
jgi:hypothetical protein